MSHTSISPTNPDERFVRLRLICLAPPPQRHENQVTVFGLQDKQRAIYPGQAQADGSVHYELEVRAKWNPKTNGPNFLGPYVHGTPKARFLYLSWGYQNEEKGGWIKRLKVHLASITWEQIEAVTQMEDGLLEARVEGSGSASVPLLGEGWTVRKRRNA